MDALIFVGLLVSVVLLFRQEKSRTALIVWWITMAATVFLLSHHITSGLGLGLSW
ncbi:MAG: DUF5993 family protein [Gordonia sp. (in: high G+C Gram-positive bacteria)]|uniref:DUF5993 family protein n=1 Tax=Gordonia sp. (in: high G+C Gram-positive bacteria) TaxID=84139 RepID=UPI003BB810B8